VGSSTAFPTNAKVLLWPGFQGSHSEVNSFQGGFIQISPVHTRTLSIVTGKGKAGRCCCRSVNLLEAGEREKGTRQCNVLPGEKRNTGSFCRDSSWLGSKYGHKKAI